MASKALQILYNFFVHKRPTIYFFSNYKIDHFLTVVAELTNFGTFCQFLWRFLPIRIFLPINLDSENST